LGSETLSGCRALFFENVKVNDEEFFVTIRVLAECFILRFPDSVGALPNWFRFGKKKSSV
jgi:hypothetical protein